MSGPRRADAGVAVSDLFARSSATGGLATRPTSDDPSRRVSTRRAPVARLRQSVELAEDDVDFLRSLSRPARTGQPRTLGSNFVASGVLAAAIELLREGGIEMDGVEAGDLDEMSKRARAALTRAATAEPAPDDRTTRDTPTTEAE